MLFILFWIFYFQISNFQRNPVLLLVSTLLYCCYYYYLLWVRNRRQKKKNSLQCCLGCCLLRVNRLYHFSERQAWCLRIQSAFESLPTVKSTIEGYGNKDMNEKFSWLQCSCRTDVYRNDICDERMWKALWLRHIPSQKRTCISVHAP